MSGAATTAASAPMGRRRSAPKPALVMRRAILTVAMSGILIAFLSPLAYSALISLKSEAQISQPNSPLLPSDPATFDYQGRT